MNRPLALGLAGLGTVGQGVLRLLQTNAALIAARAGRPIAVTAVSARHPDRPREVSIAGLRWVDDPLALAADPSLDAIVEVIGGAEGIARGLVEAALAAGKPVVTANKALLAVHGAKLAALAERSGVSLAFEAAVAGGIPIIKTLREGLAANRIDRVAGILNGTCNYILSLMQKERREFESALAEATRLGYAEADPSCDIDAIDAAHKLAILAALAFGRPVALDDVYVEGIRRIATLDIGFAEELGYRIKLLGIAERRNGGIAARVHPCMLPKGAPLARIGGVTNAVVAEGDFIGRVMLEGPGAGGAATASAVIADVIDLARARTTPVWGAAPAALSALPAVPMAEHRGCYYLRLMVEDRSGVIADMAGVLRDLDISVESLLQRGRSPAEAVPLVLVTHATREAPMRAAVAALGALDVVLEEPVLIRIEPK